MLVMSVTTIVQMYIKKAWEEKQEKRAERQDEEAMTELLEITNKTQPDIDQRDPLRAVREIKGKRSETVPPAF